METLKEDDLLQCCSAETLKEDDLLQCCSAETLKEDDLMQCCSAETLKDDFKRVAKKTINFVMSVRLSARVEQLSCHCNDFCEILCCGLNI